MSANDFGMALPEYLRSPCPNVWDWSERGNVATWSEGTTAAFSPQLAIVLERLHQSRNGLPPLTSILFVLDAASSTSRENSTDAKLERMAKLAEQQSLGGIGEMLRSIGQLPIEVRSGVDKQIALLEYLLGDCPASLYEASDSSIEPVLAWLRMDPDERPLGDEPERVKDALYRLARNRRTFAALFFMAARPVDDQAIELLRRTGLDALPEPVDNALPQFDSAGDLLRELRDDDRFGKLARAALAVAAMLSLPRRPDDHDQLPAGGVSDVTNRGNPEQLLMSELAQEPMALLARIATGQALYLRRESPPAPRPLRQPVLLEAGIRTWGKRRLQIAAIALGLTAALQRRDAITVNLFTVAGDEFWSELFHSRAGLIDHLERLPTDIHPGPAIARWTREATAGEASGDAAPAIIVLTADTDADRGFQHSMAAVRRPYLIIRVEPNDTARVLRRTAMGDECLQTIALADASLGSPGAALADALPTFLSLERSPLRFGYEFAEEWCCVGADSTLWLVTRDARLLWYPEPDRGAIEVARGICLEHIRAHRTDAHQLYLVVVPGHDSGYVVRADGPGQTMEKCSLDLREVDVRKASFSICWDAVWAFHEPYLSLFDPRSGQRLARERTQGKWIGDHQLLRPDGQIEVKSRVVGQIASYRVAHNLPSLPGHFIHAAGTGSVVVSESLKEWRCLTEGFTVRKTEVEIAGGSANFLACSRDGQRLLFALSSAAQLLRRPKQGRTDRAHRGSRYIIISLNGEPTQVLGDVHSTSVHYVFERTKLPSRSPTVRRNLIGIQPHADGLILYRSSTRAAIQLQLGTDQRHLQGVFYQGSDPVVPVLFGESTPIDPSSGGKGPQLHPAELRGGKIWLDSRGLLHLRSARDDSELTLVLHDEHLAGWSTQDGCFGPPFFLGDEHARAVPPSVVQWLRDFNADCL